MSHGERSQNTNGKLAKWCKVPEKTVPREEEAEAEEEERVRLCALFTHQNKSLSQSGNKNIPRVCKER